MMDQNKDAKQKAEVAQRRARAFVSAEIARSATNRETGPKQGERQRDDADGDKRAKRNRMSQGGG